jgi:predicted small secreted protein
MKRIISVITAVLLFAALLSGCGEKNAAVGVWQDKKELITLEFKNDGTGTLSIYVKMLHSTSENKIVYTCEGDTIRWKLSNESSGDDSGGYSTFQIEDDTIDYEGITLYKK